jgi:hypothetical protein
MLANLIPAPYLVRAGDHVFSVAAIAFAQRLKTPEDLSQIFGKALGEGAAWRVILVSGDVEIVTEPEAVAAMDKLFGPVAVEAFARDAVAKNTPTTA